MRTQINNNNDKLDPGFWIGLILLIIFIIFSIQKCNAQTKQTNVYDTVMIDRSDIRMFTTTKSTNGKERIYAVIDSKTVQDFVPITLAVFQYIDLCEKNKIQPHLGLKLKNGRITSVIKVQPKYVIKK